MTLSHEFIITLQQVKGIGATSITKICEKVAKSSGIDDLKALYGLIEQMIGRKEIIRVSLPDYCDFQDANAAAQDILEDSEKRGIKVVSRYDADFPKNLLNTVDESGKPAIPSLLYYKGDLSVTNKPALAVIGTREPTQAGVVAGTYFSEAFASIGVNIVSGLALGCDTSGHRGALNVGGATTAFLAHGLDTIYPPENKNLAAEIVDKGGLLMTEYPLGIGVNRYNLVARDRLQAGLADSTLVVMTGVHGGTMHAVRATHAAGKPIFVVDFSSYQGEKAEGNTELKLSMKAQGLRIKKEVIASEPEKFINMIKGISAESNDKLEEPKATQETIEQPTLF